jgi:dsDNA-specific endonuclease/ATPase MutS2
MTDTWEEKYNKEHKLRQEAEGEMSILKTISVHSSPEMREAKAKIEELHNSLERFKKENNECYNRIANLLKENEELKEDNRKISKQIEDRIDRMRKAGM